MVRADALAWTQLTFARMRSGSTLTQPVHADARQGERGGQGEGAGRHRRTPASAQTR
jgi:hypothetical protein